MKFEELPRKSQKVMYQIGYDLSSLKMVNQVNAILCAVYQKDQFLIRYFMPRLTKVSGEYSFGLVRPSVGLSVCPNFCRHYFETVRRSLLILIYVCF